MWSTGRRRAIIKIVATFTVAYPGAALGVDGCVSVVAPRLVDEDYTIGIRAVNGTPEDLLRAAAESWQTCGPAAQLLPRFVMGAAATRQLSVEWRRGAFGTGHCGRLEGTAIIVFSRALTAHGQLVSCGNPVQILAHEMGHVLGLRDAPPTQACHNYVMGPASGAVRSVQPSECRQAAARWEASVRLFEASRPSVGFLARRVEPGPGSDGFDMDTLTLPLAWR